MRAGVAATVLLLLCHCGSRGEVTFVLHDAEDGRMRPDPTLVSEYLIKAPNGDVVGIASVNAQSMDPLKLGVLAPSPAPRDLTVDVLSGTVLLGRARVAGVRIRPGQGASYDAEIRKPLVFVGFDVPAESGGTMQPGATKILDPSTADDLAHPRQGANPAVTIAGDVMGGAVTWSGRFFLEERPLRLSVFDIGRAQQVGDIGLPFTPVRIAVAPHDTAAAVVGGGGKVVLFSDVGALTGNPGGVQPGPQLTLSGQARAAAFSPDGGRLYVLTGGTSVFDPCDGVAPPANAIQLIGVDGSLQGSWVLPSFAAGMTVEPTTGTVLVSLSIANRVSALDPTTPPGPVTPTDRFTATCPGALAVVGGLVVTVSAALDPASVTALRYRDLVVGSATQPTPNPTLIPFPETFLDQPDPLTRQGTDFQQVLRVRPRSMAGYELQVTPDGSRAVFAARTHYLVQNGDLGFASCRAFIDAIEYGLYNVDLRSGASQYEKRAQLISTGGMCEFQCVDSLGIPTTLPCQPMNLTPGDRPSGIAGIFGGP